VASVAHELELLATASKVARYGSPFTAGFGLVTGSRERSLCWKRPMDDSDRFDRLPIIPHENFGADCWGCLIVKVRGDQADILCNECAALIRTVPLADVEAAMLEMSQTDRVCSALCPHCGTVNTFSGWAVIEAFI
jgi:hypothetical protein